jgi:L-lysine 2,3-aminomutase
LSEYLAAHQEITDILLTGGDPMWMDNQTLFSYLDILMESELDHVTSVRIGTKALAFLPERFLGADGDELMEKFTTMIHAGKNIALMAHFSHPAELKTKKVRQAIRRLRDAGVVIRTQAPLIKGINDSADIWTEMWQISVELGLIPYYMFVERDTGAHDYFSVPLAEAYEIFTTSYSQISGLAKTVRGPSMSAWPGKVLVSGILGEGNDKKFLLKFIQSRNQELINKPFYAEFDAEATWLSDLKIEKWMQDEIRQMQGELLDEVPVPGELENEYIGRNDFED